MVLLGNPNHANVKPILVGQPSRVKVNANIGTSPFQNHPGCEMRKLESRREAGADTVMDLSIAGDLVAIRRDMLARTPLPLGTVPLYSVAQRYIDKDRDPADIDPEELFAEVEMQAEQGVDFMTLHCGLTRRGAEWAARGERALGIVSRGGSILARWMLKNDKENPLLTGYDRLLELARKYNVTLSLGDGLRPGAGCDAGDAAQWEVSAAALLQHPSPELRGQFAEFPLTTLLPLALESSSYLPVSVCGTGTAEIHTAFLAIFHPGLRY